MVQLSVMLDHECLQQLIIIIIYSFIIRRIAAMKTGSANLVVRTGYANSKDFFPLMHEHLRALLRSLPPKPGLR